MREFFHSGSFSLRCMAVVMMKVSVVTMTVMILEDKQTNHVDDVDYGNDVLMTLIHSILLITFAPDTYIC